MTRKSYTLYELNGLVREAIEGEMNCEYWVEAELSEVRESRGHCYMELIEKEEGSNTPVARASARCWKSTWMLVRPHFERITGQQLHAGMKVLLLVYPQFHEAYGFSWIVTDINPEFTMGDMMRRRQEIVRQLKEEGVFDLQKELCIPVFAQRIAVVSSATAAGYGDFCHQLDENEYGFVFHTELFAATMQGEQVEQSVIAALNRINGRLGDFDVVVMIRGGGATADLSGFDTLMLAENVANFPLPIITGIGHERDESILDMISNTRVKTPTAAAAFLIEHLKQVYERVNAAETMVRDYVSGRIQLEQLRVERLAKLVPHLPQQRFAAAKQLLSAFKGRIPVALRHIVEKRNYRLSAISYRLEGFDPQRLLKRGYSITLHNGKVVRDPKQLNKGDEIETRVEKGTLKSIVK
ncbi:MAG: exodeoxyribonuclease VII large subunit [Prevotella sp.]|nr:exodeoxyribonuclease VII large subunit [Prevotella sp.]